MSLGRAPAWYLRADRVSKGLINDLWSASLLYQLLSAVTWAAEKVVAGAFRRRCHGRMPDAATGRQIDSECLIMPDTRPDQPAARCLACSGRGSPVP
jgi:hypothetical protein